MNHLVSIIIPAYNSQEFLRDTVRSGLGQTWFPKELIIVDDGSTDETLAVAREFESPHCKVVTQEHQGAAAARNHALSLAQGEFIQWLDSDDLISPDKISHQMTAAEEWGSKTLYSSGWAHFRYRTCKARFTATALWADMDPLDWMILKMERNLHMQTATWLVSRELTNIAGPWDTTLFTDDDGEYFARVLMASAAVKFVPRGKVYYRLSPYSRLSYIGSNQRKIEAQFKSMELNIGYLRSLEDSARVRAACAMYLGNWLITFYPERPDLVARARRLAATLGADLTQPVLPWKYSWIQRTLGWPAAKWTQNFYNQMKAELIRHWDKALFHMVGNSSKFEL